MSGLSPEDRQARAKRAHREQQLAAERQRRSLTRKRLAEGQQSGPTPERRRHGAVRRSKRQINDAAGGIGLPWRTVDLLGSLVARGTIDEAMREAGERFWTLFRRAGLPDLKAAALDRATGTPLTISHAATGGNEAARRRLGVAIRALGGHRAPAASCIWHVIGLEWSLRQWSVTHWGCKADVATGVLAAGLGVLAEHFRLDRLSDKNDLNR